MLPDWVLLILLFVGIAIMPMYDQARMMTPFEYFAGGLGALFESGECRRYHYNDTSQLDT